MASYWVSERFNLKAFLKFNGLSQTVDTKVHDGLVQDCSNSIAIALELLQSCIKASM